jgi:hypothetical protein
MKRILLIALALASVLAAATPKKPKLVLAIVIDQFRYDYLTRFRSEYKAGFDRLLNQGAVFTNANYIHFPTVTAVGHSTFLTGATPSVSGIVGNDWIDPDTGKHVTSVSDAKTQLLGATGEGGSPRRMLVSTVGDELKMANARKSRVISVSLKDRGAILPAGHMADGAYWFHTGSGNFVTSTYYLSVLPGWVKDFNAARLSEKFRGLSWLTHTLPMDLPKYFGNSSESPFEASPFGNDLVEQFAERALSAEQLGTREFTDILAVSFSSNDKVGHDYGPYSAEQHEVTVQTDRILERLFQAVDRQVGLDNVLIVLTGDHGVAPSPEEDAANRMPGGRMPGRVIRDAITAALDSRFGTGDWIAGSWDLSVYLKSETIRGKKLDPAEVRRVAADAVSALPHISRVYTRDQLMTGSVPGDETSRRVMNGFNPKRSPDLSILPDPYWIVGTAVTTHGTTYGYDSHVPIVFLGPGIRAGRYYRPVIVNDIAPTLAAVLRVETPSGAVGRVLSEMFAQ